MKKLILPFVFVMSLTFGYANNTQTLEEDDSYECHIFACGFIGFVQEFGDDITDSEDLYNLAYDICTKA